AVGIGAHELGGDLGAVDGRGDDAEITLDHRDVEAREMENLENVLVRHQRAQVRRVVGAAVELHDMGVAVARRKLDHAKLVALGIEPHRLGIDRDAGAESEACREIALVQRDRHMLAPLGLPGEGRERNGAQEKTRTSTPLRAPAPEAGASTNSATWAREPLLK